MLGDCKIMWLAGMQACHISFSQDKGSCQEKLSSRRPSIYTFMLSFFVVQDRFQQDQVDWLCWHISLCVTPNANVPVAGIAETAN